VRQHTPYVALPGCGQECPLHRDGPMRKAQLTRHGVVALLAMLFLVLFAALAVGIYAETNTNSMVANNEKNGTISLTAAESGMDFMHYQLSLIKVPPTTPQDQIFSYVADHLKTNMEGTANLGTNTVALTSSTVTIPANPNAYIKVDTNGAQFRATIESIGQQIKVKTTGRFGTTVTSSRAVQMNYQRTNMPTTIFDFAVASKGKVLMQKGALTSTTGVPSSIASVMSGKSTTPAVSVSGGTIGGDLSITAPGLATVTGGSVGGSTVPADIIANHTHIVGTPEFPIIDTTVFKPYAVNTYSSGSLLKNVRIPPNANPKFTGGATIQGLLYIESPNTVEFRGNVQLQGFIVFENKGNSATNMIDMRGNFSQVPLPAGAEFDPIRWMTGISLLAPTAKIVISGSVDSFLKGNVILGTFSNGGSADWSFDKGSLITLDPGDSAIFNGKTVKFASTGQLNLPTAGLKYSSYFSPDGVSYEEVKP
jgi:Tfp pilus assembly protein PilX